MKVKCKRDIFSIIYRVIIASKVIALALDKENSVRDNWRMDWKKLISEIQACGFSQAAIGAEIGKSQVWVADVLRGRYGDVKWNDGQALIALRAKLAKQNKEA